MKTVFGVLLAFAAFTVAAQNYPAAAGRNLGGARLQVPHR